MDTLFIWCVDILSWLAALVGMTYNEVNIWIFVIIEPAIFLLMLYLLVRQSRKIRLLNKALNHEKGWLSE